MTAAARWSAGLVNWAYNFRVGGADHVVKPPQALLPGFGWLEHSYGGFGECHPRFHLYAGLRQLTVAGPFAGCQVTLASARLGIRGPSCNP